MPIIVTTLDEKVFFIVYSILRWQDRNKSLFSNLYNPFITDPVEFFQKLKYADMNHYSPILENQINYEWQVKWQLKDYGINLYS